VGGLSEDESGNDRKYTNRIYEYETKGRMKRDKNYYLKFNFQNNTRKNASCIETE
jgi:hypothetical protein